MKIFAAFLIFGIVMLLVQVIFARLTRGRKLLSFGLDCFFCGIVALILAVFFDIPFVGLRNGVAPVAVSGSLAVHASLGVIGLGLASIFLDVGIGFFGKDKKKD